MINSMKRKFTVMKRNVMPSGQTLNLIKFVACIVLVVGLGANASASCGDSLAAMAAAASAHQSNVQSSPIQAGMAPSSDGPVNPSIVGLWYTRFIVGGQTIQEAFQAWNTGGTEIHNPNVDPRTGNVCLGTWKKVAPLTYKLAHRVWMYDASGNFQGTIHLGEALSLGDNGNTHSGSFTLDFYDPKGNFLFEVAGDVAAERISVE